MLFAGALGVNSHALWSLRGPVVSFALLSTALSIGLVGVTVYGLVNLFGLQLEQFTLATGHLYPSVYRELTGLEK